MFTYILKRLLAMIPTLIGITFVTFLIIRLAPGDPVAAQFGKGGGERTASDSGSTGEMRNDAIRAKKKLLGMLEELHGVIAFDGARASAARNYVAKDKYKTWDDLDPTDELGDLDQWISAIEPSRDGRTLFIADQSGAVQEMDAASGDIRRLLHQHAVQVWALAASADGRFLVSADVDGIVQVARLEGTEVKAASINLDQTVRGLAVHPSSQWFVTAGSDGKIRIHEFPDGKVRGQFSAHVGYVSDVIFSADGTSLYTAGYDRTVMRFAFDAAGSVPAAGTKVGEAGQPILDIDLSADGTRIVAGSEDNGVWIFATGKSGDAAIEPIVLKGHVKPVTAVAFLPDGRTVLSASRDESMCAWDVEKRELTAQTSENAGLIRHIAVSPDGKRIYSVGDSWRSTGIAKQYLTWVSKLIRLDFGNSFRYPDKQVIDLVFEAAPVTIGLNLFAIFIIYVIAIPLGVVAAVKRGTKFDNATSFVLFLLWSMPSFWVATLLIINFSSEKHFNWFDSVGLHSANQRDLPYLAWLADWGQHMILPVIAMVYSGFTVLSRFARSSMLETLSQDYVRTARAKGLSERVVVFRHAFRNSLISIVTLLGGLLPGMIGGSVIIEVIFTIDGMGKLGFSAILARDYPVIMAVTTISAVLTLFGILLSDLLYSLVDPRINVG